MAQWHSGTLISESPPGKKTRDTFEKWRASVPACQTSVGLDFQIYPLKYPIIYLNLTNGIWSLLLECVASILVQTGAKI